MKFNKNMLTLAICLAIFSPARCDQSIEETRQETETVELLGIDLADARLILENMINILDSFANNLVDGIQFKLNDQMYAVEFDTKKITAQQQDAITTILIDVVDSVIDAIADKIHEAQIHTISQEDAIALLQATANNLQTLADNLVVGTSFNLNGTNYIVQTHKTVESIDAYTTTNS